MLPPSRPPSTVPYVGSHGLPHLPTITRRQACELEAEVEAETAYLEAQRKEQQAHRAKAKSHMKILRAEVARLEELLKTVLQERKRGELKAKQKEVRAHRVAKPLVLSGLTRASRAACLICPSECVVRRNAFGRGESGRSTQRLPFHPPASVHPPQNVKR